MLAKLTKKMVDAAKPGVRDTFLWDPEVKGFGLKVTPAGKRIYILQTRLRGRLRRFTIGTHGSPWTPDLAREEAIALLASVVRGVDPLQKMREARVDLTVAALCDVYLAEGCGGKKPSTILLDRSRVERHVKPLLGHKRLLELTRSDLERFMVDVAVGKTAVDERTRQRGRAMVTGGRGTATRVMGMLGAILQFAVNRGLRVDNPARGIRRYPDKHFERFLTGDELLRLADSFASAQKRAANSYALAAIRLLVLTGARKSEILKLRWDWVDIERSCLRLPDSKTGPKLVHLGSAAIDILASLQRLNGNPHVIPGAKTGHHFVGLQKFWKRIRADAGLPDLRLHDLRHHFISAGASSGESLYILGKVAGHKQAATTQRYAHVSDHSVMRAADRVSHIVQESMRTRSEPSA